jgi:hypothetical protein
MNEVSSVADFGAVGFAVLILADDSHAAQPAQSRIQLM